MGIQPGARLPALSADALPATLYGHFDQVINRNQSIHPARLSAVFMNDLLNLVMTRMKNALRPTIRGLHSSTSQLNLSRFGHTSDPVSPCLRDWGNIMHPSYIAKCVYNEPNSGRV
jgi:hypothetical protein